MKRPPFTFVVLLVCSVASFAQQVSLATSHAPTVKAQPAPAPGANSAKPAVRVNGTVLTETDVVREMYRIFPYADQHKGFPKDAEPEIRRGAVNMIIFEELLYQEAKRRGMTIAPVQLSKAASAIRRQFPDKQSFQDYLRKECNGSEQVFTEKVRRSLLIERMLKTEVEQKTVVTPAAVKTYYDQNSKQFERAESFAIQTISIIPPENATKQMKDEAKAKIKDIARLGREAKTPRDFGLIAEQLSDDDWRTKLGDRGNVPAANLPPEVVKAARAMKVGQVSDPIQLDRAWVVIRLNGHTAAGKATFAEVKAKLQADLKKQKTEQIRAELNKKLRKDAKVEVL